MRSGDTTIFAICPIIFVILSCAILNAQPKKTQAQHLIDVALQHHPEIAELELSATPQDQGVCITIAATPSKQLGEKCDDDELTALRTRQPLVEMESDGFDVTAPLRDVKGMVIGTLGIDFKLQPGQTKRAILKQTAALLRELEPQIRSRSFLFEPIRGD
jgi:hypothetical protein